MKYGAKRRMILDLLEKGMQPNEVYYELLKRSEENPEVKVNRQYIYNVFHKYEESLAPTIEDEKPTTPETEVTPSEAPIEGIPKVMSITKKSRPQKRTPTVVDKKFLAEVIKNVNKLYDERWRPTDASADGLASMLESTVNTEIAKYKIENPRLYLIALVILAIYGVPTIKQVQSYMKKPKKEKQKEDVKKLKPS